MREMERRQNQHNNANTFRLPRIDFSRYDGGDPLEWKLNCEFYFEMYQVPEGYKTRMMVLHFSEELNEWYKTLLVGNQSLPWDLLVEEVNARFRLVIHKHSIEEFKRLHQIGTI
jgi:hypothetical protein